jgi:small subunit ribosomal protein S4
VREGSRKRTYFTDLDASGIMRKKAVPEWLSLDPATLSARVMRLPDRGELDLSINEQLIVEFYSR